MSATPPRLIAVDMDGTFLDSNSEYDRDRFDRLHRRLRALNIRFVVASGNDVEMLAFAGTGVAMANAPDSVKRHADTCTGSNDEDGVMEFVEQVLTSTSQ